MSNHANKIKNAQVVTVFHLFKEAFKLEWVNAIMPLSLKVRSEIENILLSASTEMWEEGVFLVYIEDHPSSEYVSVEIGVFLSL